MYAAAQVEATAQKALLNGGLVHLHIKSGKGLIAKDTNLFSKSSSDPYVAIKCGGNRIVGKTQVIKKTLDPVWNENFEFTIGPKESPLIVLAIYDQDKIGKDDPMGIVTIPLSLVIEAEYHKLDREFVVEKCEGAKKDNLGSLSLSISFDPVVPVAMHAGDVVDVTDSKLYIGLGWEVEPEKKKRGEGQNHSQNANSKPKFVDLDASAVVFDKNGRLKEAIYFDNLISTPLIGQNAIVHQGDAVSGDEVFGGDDEKIFIDLDKLNSEVLAIFICVCAFSDGSTFQDVLDATCRVYDSKDIDMYDCHLGKLGRRTSVTMVRIFRDSVGGGWKMGSLFTPDSASRSWGFLIPQFKDNLGVDLVPGLRGHKSDRIAIMSKGQSFQIADTCDSIPDVFCVGLHWDVTEGKNIDLDASVLLYDINLKMVDYVAFNKLFSRSLAVRHMGDEREGDEVGDDETIVIDFGKLPPNINYLCVVINSYSGQELDDVKDAGCHIYSTDNPSRDICKINLSGEKTMDGKTACFVACFFKVENSWWIKCVNQGMMGRTVTSTTTPITQYLKNENMIEGKINDIIQQHEAEAAFAQNGMEAATVSSFDSSSQSIDRTSGASLVGRGGVVAGAVGVGAGAAYGLNVNSSEITGQYAQQAGGAAGQYAQQAGGVAGQYAQQAGGAAGQYAQQAGGAAGQYAQQAGGAAGQYAQQAGGAAGQYAQQTGEAAGQMLDATVSTLDNINISVDFDAALATISGLASLGSHLPCISIITPLMSGVVESAREAKYNKLAAKLLSDRVVEVAAILYDLLKNVSEASVSLNMELQRFEPLLGKCQEFMQKYAKRSYLSKMLCGYSDGENLKLLDKELTDVIQSITLSLGVMNVSMMSSQHAKLDDLAELVRSTGTSSQSETPFGEDSKIVQTIAKCVGVEAREVVGEIKQSLQSIMQSQDQISSKLDDALNKLDAVAGFSSPPSKPAPEDPKAFWDDYFGSEKTVPLEQFIPVFEEEFCPDDDELSTSEKLTLEHLLDAYPKDGLVSIVEWKRFCKQSKRAELGLKDFVLHMAST